VGADTGPADSVDTDSGPSTVSTIGPSNIPGGGGGVAAGGAVSLGSMSLPSNSLRARERV